MQTAVAKSKKRPSKPVYLRVEKLVRPSTGEEVGALVPLTQWDQREMKERKYHVGTEVRADLKKPRNGKFHRLAHVIGALLVDHVPGFESLTSHDALKRVQRESGVCCEEMELDLGTLGLVTVKVPRSIAYDEMENGEFEQFFKGVTGYIDEHYAPDLTRDVRDEYDRMVVGGA